LEEIERLTESLDEERRKNGFLEEKLAEREQFFLEELEMQKKLYAEKSDRHKETKKNYEEIIVALRQEKEIALDTAQREKLEALDKARREGKSSLIEVEVENMKQLDKIRNMLMGCQKHGVLKKQGRGMAARYKKRYFVLRDGILCYYKGETYAENLKPLGVIFLEQARLYELTDAKAKKFSFEIATPKKKYSIAAKTATEMKEWMKELKLAKKRNLGIEVVARKESLPPAVVTPHVQSPPAQAPPAQPATAPAPSAGDENPSTIRRGGSLVLSSARNHAVNKND